MPSLRLTAAIPGRLSASPTSICRWPLAICATAETISRAESEAQGFRRGDRPVAGGSEGDQLREVDGQAAGGDGGEPAQSGGGRAAAGIVVARGVDDRGEDVAQRRMGSQHVVIGRGGQIEAGRQMLGEIEEIDAGPDQSLVVHDRERDSATEQAAQQTVEQAAVELEQARADGEGGLGILIGDGAAGDRHLACVQAGLDRRRLRSARAFRPAGGGERAPEQQRRHRPHVDPDRIRARACPGDETICRCLRRVRRVGAGLHRADVAGLEAILAGAGLRRGLGAWDVARGRERSEVVRGLEPALLVEEAADIDRHCAEAEQRDERHGEEDGGSTALVAPEIPDLAHGEASPAWCRSVSSRRVARRRGVRSGAAAVPRAC